MTDEALPAKPAEGGGEIIPEWLLRLKESTPARVLVGRAGPAYRTQTHLELKGDHAAARDAVHSEFALTRDLGEELVRRYGLFEVQTRATSKQEYLVRPDYGRQLSDEAKETLRERCVPKPEIQFVIGDGLSATAVKAQVPTLLPMLIEEARARGWRVGQTFAVHYCRVGVMNDVGDALDPAVVVLLIGERPGLVTAESLSAYFAYKPRPGDTDAKRNLISNIHARGVPLEAAAARILAMADLLIRRRLSGVDVKEELPALPSGEPVRLPLEGHSPG